MAHTHKCKWTWQHHAALCHLQRRAYEKWVMAVDSAEEEARLADLTYRQNQTWRVWVKLLESR